jgi:hypothetical protein
MHHESENSFALVRALVTQIEIANLMWVKHGSISKLKRREDVFVYTLHSAIKLVAHIKATDIDVYPFSRMLLDCFPQYC